MGSEAVELLITNSRVDGDPEAVTVLSGLRLGMDAVEMVGIYQRFCAKWHIRVLAS